jgi:DNA-binding CsgD family transcriptional regulator
VIKRHYRKFDGTWELSPRELEVLLWAARGKTYEETASIMNIKFSTVHIYMGKLKLKLNATNITHAVALSYENGIIEPNTVVAVPFYKKPESLMDLEARETAL